MDFTRSSSDKRQSEFLKPVPSWEGRTPHRGGAVSVAGGRRGGAGAQQGRHTKLEGWRRSGGVEGVHGGRLLGEQEHGVVEQGRRGEGE